MALGDPPDGAPGELGAESQLGRGIGGRLAAILESIGRRWNSSCCMAQGSCWQAVADATLRPEISYASDEGQPGAVAEAGTISNEDMGFIVWKSSMVRIFNGRGRQPILPSKVFLSGRP